MQEHQCLSNVIRIEDYIIDRERFKERVEELIDGLTDKEVQRRTGLGRNHIADLREGLINRPTWDMLRRMSSLRKGYTVSWLATGHDEDEETTITTLEALHGWETKIANQRKRMFQRILNQQVAMAARQPQPDGLSQDQQELVARLQADSQAEQDAAVRPAQRVLRGHTA